MKWQRAFFLFLNVFFIIIEFRERKQEGEREKHCCERKRGSNLKPGYVPDLDSIRRPFGAQPTESHGPGWQRALKRNNSHLLGMYPVSFSYYCCYEWGDEFQILGHESLTPFLIMSEERFLGMGLASQRADPPQSCTGSATFQKRQTSPCPALWTSILKLFAIW